MDFLRSYRAEVGEAKPGGETLALAAYVRSVFGSNEFTHVE